MEQKILRRTVLSAERSRDREQQFGRLGMRDRLRKLKVALDCSLQHLRGAGGECARGFMGATISCAP